MIARACHYEMACECYFAARGIPFVAVADLRRRLPGRPGIKLFDHLVYPRGRPPTLIDVKGRKLAARATPQTRGWRSWVTRDDVDGLTEWQRRFGAGFDAAFLFAYWLAGGCDDGRLEVFRFAGRDYTFKLVRLADYRPAFRVLSPRWRTVVLPYDAFARCARALRAAWGAAAAPV